MKKYIDPETILIMTCQEYMELKDKFETYLKKSQIKRIKQHVSHLNKFLSYLEEKKIPFAEISGEILDSYYHRNFKQVYQFFIKNRYVNMDKYLIHNKNCPHQFCDYIEEYFNEKRMGGSREKTIVAYRKVLGLFGKYLQSEGFELIADISRKTVEAYSGYLLHHRKRNSNQPVRINTVRERLLIIKGYFAWLKKKNYIEYDPTLVVKLPRKEQLLMKNFLTREEIKDFFMKNSWKKYYEKRNYYLFLLMYNCGLRVNEVVHIKEKDINYETGMLHIREAKGGSERVVPMSYFITENLKNYVKIAKYEDMKEQYLFTGASGNMLLEQNLGRSFRGYLRKAGIEKKVTLHMFRHSIARHLLGSGLDIRYIQKFLGHKTIDSTAVYTSLDVRELKEALQKFHPREQHQEMYLKQSRFGRK